jgi:predicted ATPase
MAMTLEDLVSTDVVPEPHAIIIVGEPGVGKSSLIGNLRDVLVVQLIREKTWANLKQTGAVPRNVAVAKKTIDSWTAMLTLIESLMSESIKTLPYKWLAIDSLTPLATVATRRNTRRTTPARGQRFRSGSDSSILSIASGWRVG